MRELSLAEQRYQAVMAVIADGLSVSQVAEKVGVSQTLAARGGIAAARPKRWLTSRRGGLGAGDTPAARYEVVRLFDAESHGRSTLAAILRESSATGVLEFWES
jgi:transposase